MILSVFISFATLASVLDYNSFELNKNWYQQYQVQYFDTKIDNTQGDTDQANMDESGHELTYSLAKKISRNTFAYIDINYQERNETSLRYGLTTKNIYRRKGFQEPSIGFLSRRQFSKKTGQANIDFVFKYTPSIGNRAVGPNNESNNWSGRQVFQFGLTHQWD